jgi:uncharacterized protein YndB with AHSA1/START domain
VPFDVERLLRLWTDPLPEDDVAAADAFRALYADPVTVNGAPLTAADLVTRARRLQAALERPEREVLAVADAGTAVAVVFRLAGRHAGPLDTPVGPLQATGARIDLRVVDVLTVDDGRVSALWTVADWLGALTAAGLVEVPATSGQGSGRVPGAGGRLEMTTVVREPPERVFARLVTPEALARWWGPHGFSTPEVSLDPALGGRYRMTMQPPDGDAFHVTGEFLEVEPPRRLSYTFRYEEPGPDDRETVVVLTLTAVDDGTRISLSQWPFATEERLELHRRGWTESLQRLGALPEVRSSGRR